MTLQQFIPTKAASELKIALIYGGGEYEWPISIRSSTSVERALRNLGYTNIELIPLSLGSISGVFDQINADVAFNATHGYLGEDGILSLILDRKQIPYTHSGYEASRITMNKILTKKFFLEAGINVASFIRVTKEELYNGLYVEKLKHSMPAVKNFILKPVASGSSDNVIKFSLESQIDWNNKIPENKFYFHDFMIEEFISGPEYQAPILNNKSMGIIRVDFSGDIFSFDDKYMDRCPHIFDPEMDVNLKDQLQSVAEKVHNAIGCNSISRVEFKVREDGQIFGLEININPGISEQSMTPIMFGLRGVSYNDMVGQLLLSAKYQQ